jgi:hypothetical protein
VINSMETADLKGLVIFTGLVAMYAFVLLGCMERRLKKVDRAVDDLKYVN